MWSNADFSIDEACGRRVRQGAHPAMECSRGTEYLENRLKTIAAAFVLMLISASALANDSTVGDWNGGLVLLQQRDIAMVSERLLLSQEQIEVDYVFVNHADDPIRATMAFPMPPLNFGESDHSSVEHFRVWVDGGEIATRRKWVVMLDGVDLGPEIARRGWTVERLIEMMRNDSCWTGDETLPRHWFNEEGPLFGIQDYYLWEQSFPPGQPVHVRHTYRPSLSSSVPLPLEALLDDEMEMAGVGMGKQVCMDDATRRAMSRQAQPGGTLRWAGLRYVLTTGANWQDGVIGDFTMRIRKARPDDLVSLCFDGDLRRIDDRTFEFTQKDFRPVRDLQLLFTMKPRMSE